MSSVLDLPDVSTSAYSCDVANASGTYRDVNTWRERHDRAVQDQEVARQAYRKASIERALALRDGEAELGSQAAVARALGVTRPIVNRAIRALQKAEEPPG